MNPTRISLSLDRPLRELVRRVATAWSRIWTRDVHEEQRFELAQALDDRTLRDIGLGPAVHSTRR